MKKIALTVVSLLLESVLTGSFAQSNFNSEKELIRNANDFFNAEKFAEAAPLYAQLISNHPQELSYKYFYGVSLLLSSKDKGEAKEYLEMAATFSDTPPMVHYYLAKADHFLHDFDKAISEFEFFKKNIPLVQSEALQIDKLIAISRNAKIYDFDSFNSAVISKTEISEDDFLSLYDFNRMPGKFLAMQDKFTKGKNKEKFSRYVYISSVGNCLIFSGPGKLNVSSLFISNRKYGVEWSDPQPVKFGREIKDGMINPVISEDGSTIYFSSNNAKSVGGYDIFRTTFDPRTFTWTEPDNTFLNINSTDDDFYFMPSEEEGIAYLCSRNDCDAGKINVLKINLVELKNRKPAIASDQNIKNPGESSKK